MTLKVPEVKNVTELRTLSRALAFAILLLLPLLIFAIYVLFFSSISFVTLRPANYPVLGDEVVAFIKRQQITPLGKINETEPCNENAQTEGSRIFMIGPVNPPVLKENSGKTEVENKNGTTTWIGYIFRTIKGGIGIIFEPFYSKNEEYDLISEVSEHEGKPIQEEKMPVHKPETKEVSTQTEENVKEGEVSEAKVQSEESSRGSHELKGTEMAPKETSSIQESIETSTQTEEKEKKEEVPETKVQSVVSSQGSTELKGTETAPKETTSTQESSDDSDLYLPYEDWEYNIPNTLICPNDGKDLFLLVGIQSLANQFGLREAIRETWAKLAKIEGFNYVFITGIGQKDHINNRLKHESDTYEDIVQTSILDREENATAKSVVFLKWISEYCPNVKYVLRTDDHVFLNLPLLASYIKEGWLGGKIEPGKMYGFLSTGYKPERNPSKKDYVSLRQFSENTFPDYFGSEGYLFPGSFAKDLYEAALKTKFLPKENILITGVLAEKLKIPRVDIPLFAATHPDFAKNDHCTVLGYSVVIYKLYRDEIRIIWDELVKSKFDCGNFLYYALKMFPKDKVLYTTSSKGKILYPFLVDGSK